MGGMTQQPQQPHLARRSSVHAVCVAVYRAHVGGEAGCCAACGQAAPCRTRRSAVRVIEAHADDPRRYDAGVRLVVGVAAAPVVLAA
jgi:hypothetical protein